MDTMGMRLRKARLDAGYSSASAAAAAFGWKISTYAAHENGQNNYGPDEAHRYGRVFKKSSAWLLTGEGQVERQNEAPIMGYIGAGAEILPDFEQVPPEGLWQIELPFTIPDEMVAFEVKGESMLPRYDDGDVVVVYLEQRRPLEQFYGEEAAVRTTDGRRFLKRIARGSKNKTVNLESFNGRTIESVKLEWIGEIWVTLRQGQVRRIEQRERAAATRSRRAREVATRGMTELPLTGAARLQS